MEIGPIFRALMHNKSRFWLVTLEVALTLAIVANCVNMMLDMRHQYLRPSGFDEDNQIVIYTEPFAPDFKDDAFVDTIREEDLRRLEALPGVRNAIAINQIPLSGSGSSTGRKPFGSEIDTISAPYFVVTEGALQTFGVELIAGRDFVPGDFEEPEEGWEAAGVVRNVIINQKLAEQLFPEGNAVGERMQSREGERVNLVVGLVGTMHNSWPRYDGGEQTMLFPGKPGSGRVVRFLVRTEPGAVEAVYAELEGVIRDVHPDRVITVKTMAEVKRDNYSMSLSVTKLLSSIILLLVLVTSLGIIGLTSFSVTQRTRQIGTRRALGATRGDILRYFLVENWVITGIGLGLGVLLTFGLNYTLVHVADGPKMSWGLLALGALALWLTGIVAALAPALRATSVAPEIATRTV
ncbi:MAG: FtsX-like permease family protein [Acidobacteria bacterium]|nr:MAG: FtsX-like permease family protein [Acidobacteriota bacterium]